MNQKNSQLKSAKKITIFFAADGGGAQLAMVNLACELARLGKEIDLVMPELKGPYIKNLSEEVTTFDLKTRNPYKLVFKLVKYLNKRQPEFLIASQQQTNIAAIIARWFVNFPLLLVIHQNNQLSTLAHYDKRILVRLLPFFAKVLYPLADKIVAVSNGVAQDIANITDLPAKQIKIIYNPIITKQIFLRAKETPSHQWFTNLKKPIILSAGRLTRQKDFSTLIKAFAQVLEKLDCQLVIIGEGENRLELEQLISDLKLEKFVALPGFAENPYNYIKRASLFVISSAWEGLPFVLVEAMALGTPVVSTNCPSGPNEILKGGKYGDLVPVGEVAALSASIQKTLVSPLSPETLQERASLFTSEAVGQEFLDLLQTLERG